MPDPDYYEDALETQDTQNIRVGVGGVGITAPRAPTTSGVGAPAVGAPQVDWSDIDSLNAYMNWLIDQARKINRKSYKGLDDYNGNLNQQQKVATRIKELETAAKGERTGAGRAPSEAELVINHLAQRIRAGNLDVDKANAMFEDYLGIGKGAAPSRGAELSFAANMADVSQRAFQQSLPYMLPRGQEFYPGAEPGGPLEQLYRQGGAQYNPQNFRVPQVEQGAWQQAIAPLIEQFGT